MVIHSKMASTLMSGRIRSVILALIWCTSLIIGSYFCWCCRASVFGVFFDSVHSRSGILSSVMAAALPLVLTTVFGVHCPWAIYLLCFLKGFSFGFCGYGIGLSFGAASWIVWPLFLFIDATTVPVCYFYWISCLDDSVAYRYPTLMWYLVYGILIACVDHFMIAPFLASVVR